MSIYERISKLRHKMAKLITQMAASREKYDDVQRKHEQDLVMTALEITDLSLEIENEVDHKRT